MGIEFQNQIADGKCECILQCAPPLQRTELIEFIAAGYLFNLSKGRCTRRITCS